MVDTLEFSNEDEIAQDYSKIQKMFGSDIYNVYHRQEAFDKLLNAIFLA